MRSKCLFLFFVVLLLCDLSVAFAGECPPGAKGAETLFDLEGIFLGKLEGNIVLLLESREEDRQTRSTLDREQASKLFAYALKAREAAPGMNPFAPLGDMEVPKEQKPIEPAIIGALEGPSLWVHVVGTDHRDGSFIATFLIAPVQGGNSPDKNFIQERMIYETAPASPKEETIDKTTGSPAGEPLQSQEKWGERFAEFLSVLQKFTGSKLVIFG